MVTKTPLLLLALGILCGCSANSAPPASGFLGDARVYSSLKPHGTIEGVQIVNYMPVSTLRGASFILPPVKIYLNQEGLEREISQSELSELALTFHNRVFDSLSSQHLITNVPGPNVYILRLALTDADPNVPMLNIHPGTVVSGVGLGGATVEMAIEDSTTGNLIMAATASKKGARYNYVSGLSKWGHTEEVLSDFAKAINDRLVEINQG